MRREMILEIIKDNPGIGFNGISRHSKLSNGVISHYILQLLKDGEITKSGIRAKYFLKGIPIKHRELIIILSNTTNLRIIKLLLEKEVPLKSRNISKFIKKSLSTVSVSMKNMEKAGIISRKILHEESNLMSDIGFNISNRSFLEKIISKYDLN